MKQLRMMVAFLGLFLYACNKSGEAYKTSQMQSITDDPELSEEAAQVGLIDSIESLSDSNLSEDKLRLSLSDTNSNNGNNQTQSCTVSGDKAIVEIKRDRVHNFEFSGKKHSLNLSMESHTLVNRTWSKTNGAVACQNKKNIALDFANDQSGLQLDLNFSREKIRKFALNTVLSEQSDKTGDKTGDKPDENPKKTQTSINKDCSMQAKGERKVQWISETKNTDGTTSRIKQIESKVERSHTRKDKDGVEQKLQFSVHTDGPLKIEEVYKDINSRKEKEQDLATKTIQSGKVIVEKAKDGKIVSSIDMLKLDLNGHDCKFVSGKVKVEFFAEGSDKASKVYEFTSDKGEVTLMDISDPLKPIAATDFEFEPCDIDDFSF
ncbi:MAG: hypothetical protein NTX25_12585 [Proteobacteria bacterium]|nr:hypothetical protein [Pseudomonadota bacterium]